MVKLLLVVVFFNVVALSSLNAASCDISPAQYQEFVNQDFDTFDQKPTGWRKLNNGSAACNMSILFVLDAYHIAHQSTLFSWQNRLLHWHSGQFQAFLLLNNLAISRFALSLDSQEPPNPSFHWNAYVRATLAFMNKDKVALQKAHDEYTTVAPAETQNFKIVERYMRCFDSSYYEVYTATGTCLGFE